LPECKKHINNSKSGFKANPARWRRAEFSAKAEITASVQKLNTNDSIDYEWRRDCHLVGVNGSTAKHDAENREVL
jgi:hypothetical protein